MDSKKCKRMIMKMVMALLMMSSVSVMGHLPPGTCIDRCLKECKSSGIGVASCIKYCPVHCLPPASSTKDHYCNLGCMLDDCAKFVNDEKKMTDCVIKCRKYHCKISTKIEE